MYIQLTHARQLGLPLSDSKASKYHGGTLADDPGVRIGTAMIGAETALIYLINARRSSSF
jgi:hypothetical protein